MWIYVVFLNQYHQIITYLNDFDSIELTRFWLLVSRVGRVRISSAAIRMEKLHRSGVQLSEGQKIFIIFWLIWNQTDVRLDPNQSKNGKYNLISGWFNKISETFLCVLFLGFGQYCLPHGEWCLYFLHSLKQKATSWAFKALSSHDFLCHEVVTWCHDRGFPG